MSVMDNVVVFVLCFAFCSGHICLLSPTQRGGFPNDLNEAGSDDCLKTTGPCGEMRPDTPPKAAISAGANVSVVWQKNLDHYNAARPGYFSIKLGKTQSNLVEVYRVPDDWQKSLSLYTQALTAPKNPGYYVLQVEYFTNNSTAPPGFYQCSDFIVFPPITTGLYNYTVQRHFRKAIDHL